MAFYFLSLPLSSPPQPALPDMRQRSALAFARRAHTNFRMDGQPAVSHPIAVEKILRSVSPLLPDNAYIAALLHDVLEDTNASFAHLWNEFGREVSDVVWALTKLPTLPAADKQEHEQLYLEQMKRVNEKYPYTLLVKLADRVHNVETIAGLPLQRRRRLLRETEFLYLPTFINHAVRSEGAVRRAAHALTARLVQNVKREQQRLSFV